MCLPLVLISNIIKTLAKFSQNNFLSLLYNKFTNSNILSNIQKQTFRVFNYWNCFDHSLKIRDPVLVKRAEFIHDRKVCTKFGQKVILAKVS